MSDCAAVRYLARLVRSLETPCLDGPSRGLRGPWAGASVAALPLHSPETLGRRRTNLRGLRTSSPLDGACGRRPVGLPRAPQRSRSRSNARVAARSRSRSRLRITPPSSKTRRLGGASGTMRATAVQAYSALIPPAVLAAVVRACGRRASVGRFITTTTCPTRCRCRSTRHR